MPAAHLCTRGPSSTTTDLLLLLEVFVPGGAFVAGERLSSHQLVDLASAVDVSLLKNSVIHRRKAK